jgi:pyroglutamyl-peptidase
MTGFEPFGGETVNASWEAVRRLEGERIGNAEIHTLLLPTVFGEADERLIAATRRFKPSAVIMVGQAAGRRAIALEKRAVNRAHALIADNAGRQPLGRQILPGGPPAYAASLPIAAITGRLKQAGIEVEPSFFAGTFVCNSVFFAACHHRETTHPEMKVGFIHVPVLPEQAAGQQAAKRGLLPSMHIERMVSGLKLAAAASLGAVGLKTA